ncbi:MAG TPA: helix-turn-helix domain-containing protein [Coleofasciculaceae cyanobacterium]
MNPSNSELDCLLRSRLQALGIPSFRALSQIAGVSKWQVEQLRKGQAAGMRVDVLHRLSQALQMSLSDLLSAYADLVVEPDPENPSAASTLQLKQEYERLQAQLQQQRELLQQEFQQDCLRSLESWLIQFPTLVHAAQHNPQFPSKNFLPFIRPLEQLLHAWGVEAIAPVGAEIPYDPQLHQLLEGSVQAGDLVKVRYTGYRQGEKLLYRAKVSPVQVSSVQVSSAQISSASS